MSRDGVAIGHFEYDANGNRTLANGISAAYDDQDRLTDFGGVQYSYTANGELKQIVTGAGVTAYEYDVFGNLVRADLSDGSTLDYVVDGRQRRIGKKLNGTSVQGFLYQDQLKPAAELDAQGNVVSRFVYASKINVPEYMVKSGVAYRIVTDQLGSVRLVVDSATGQVAQRIDYDEWGNVLQDTNPGFQPFGFAGGLHDRHTGLVRFGARDYDPKTGRWTAKDPIGFAGGDANLYSYVKGNPLSYIDPLGLNPATAIGAGIGSIVMPGPGTVAGAVIGSAIGVGIGSLIFNTGDSNAFPAGVWPGDKGAAEWGRRNGVGAREGKGRFHGVKQSCGGRGKEDFGVDPDTGDVYDPAGDVVGNLGDVKSK